MYLKSDAPFSDLKKSFCVPKFDFPTIHQSKNDKLLLPTNSASGEAESNVIPTEVNRKLAIPFIIAGPGHYIAKRAVPSEQDYWLLNSFISDLGIRKWIEKFKWKNICAFKPDYPNFKINGDSKSEHAALESKKMTTEK